MKMNQETEGLRLNQIKSFCIVLPDSCILLNYIFNEEEFRPKIEYFVGIVMEGIPCEILPRVNVEITKKLVGASGEYVGTIRKCRDIIQAYCTPILSEVSVSKSTAQHLEYAFSRIFGGISGRTDFRTYGDKMQAISRARVVETSVLLELWEVLNSREKITLSAFFDRLESKFKEKYIEFCDKQSLFMKALNAKPLKEGDIAQTSSQLEELLSKCVHNPKDVGLLCEAFGRMYKTAKWCAVVTIDYSDIVKNNATIEELTLLSISDPLYFAYHLDRKIDLALNPKDAAMKLKLNYKEFIKPPTLPVGVV